MSAGAGPKLPETVLHPVTGQKIFEIKTAVVIATQSRAAYAFIPQLELYAEPSMAYYINNKSDIPDLWKDKPLNFIFQVGLRQTFNRSFLSFQ